MKFIWVALATVFFMALNINGQTNASKTKIPLNDGWRFRQAGKTEWHPAGVPGVVQTDLLENKLIEDPFYRDNEKNLQWIGKTDWEYEMTFQISPETMRRGRLELLFEGLDTYAEVFLNDRKILDADNMFRRWRVDVKDAVRSGENVLRIKFRSPINEVLPHMKTLGYELPASNDQGEKTSPYTRKAPYQYGWDWGPRFVTSGIWKPVFLEAWDDARIEDLHIKQNKLSKENADLTAVVEVIAAADAEATVEVENKTDGKTVAAKKVQLKKGVNPVPLDFAVKDPRLWYPVGLGEQALYDFTAKLKIKDRAVDEKKTRTGLRTLELRQKPDQWGKSFTFVINGIPVFGKGANWIPADSFPTRVTKERYRHLLESVRDANMNMVRVWGGGIYEDDYYYQLADELGILVWQDFMFACSMYPADREFLANVRQEAIDNVKRLRDHPSIVLWCGNNEVETAWNHWGWRQQLPDHIWDDYLKIFSRLLPEVVEEYDPETPYWPSSPSSNYQEDSDSQKIGDVHYWGVWHASLPFAEYEKQFPRFMSEYGFQSFPEPETVRSYTLPEDRQSIEAPVMLAHQRHPRGNQLIREYMLREYVEPKDFESFLYVSQVLQAEGIKTGTEHFRRIMPQNMGALYWQINDCWTVASWSGMDYFGRWKALHYYARRFFAPLMVSPHVSEGKMEFYIVSDFPEPKKGELVWTLFDLEGRELKKKSVAVDVEPIKGKSYLSVPVEELLGGQDATNAVLVAELKTDGRTVSQNEYFFKPFKELKLDRPEIKTGIAPSEKGFTVTVSSDKVARAVYLYGNGGEGAFSDNFFNLIPGRAVTTEFRTARKMSADEFRKMLKIRTLLDAFK
ncbi:MAG: glycoside hydrolase family 2 protein [Pyrinomonadaceae bacterium]